MKVAGTEIGFIYKHSDRSSEIRQFERFALTDAEQEEIRPSLQDCLQQLVSMSDETGKDAYREPNDEQNYHGYRDFGHSGSSDC